MFVGKCMGLYPRGIKTGRRGVKSGILRTCTVIYIITDSCMRDKVTNQINNSTKCQFY